MRDGRFATPRFNAAVDGAPMLRARSEVARRKSVELKQDFFEILAYRDTITRCDNRTRSPCCARAASGHAAAAPPSRVMSWRRLRSSISPPPGTRCASLLHAHQDAPQQTARVHQGAYSIFSPSFLITAAHLSSSRSMLAAYSSGVLAIGSAPSATIRFVISSDSIVERSALLSRSMMRRGVPAGADSP